MSPMSLFACLAASEALADAGYDITQALPRMGVSAGSTIGSPAELNAFFSEYCATGSVEDVRTTTFFKIMGHTVASSIAMMFRCTGRQLAAAAACASGLLGIGLGYEAVAAGREPAMLCGGADEFHLLTAATFDRMGALSRETDPARASRPFDAARSGLVCGEGAGILVLERLADAQARGAAILAEITGFSAVTSALSVAYPDEETIIRCMGEALEDASVGPEAIDYVNAHATGTPAGDAAEGRAVAKLFGQTPVSSLKGHMGHTLAASGALETIACVRMMREGVCLPTLHLSEPDPQCGAVAHLFGPSPVPLCQHTVIKNSFAMGGVYTSLVLKTWAG